MCLRGQGSKNTNGKEAGITCRGKPYCSSSSSASSSSSPFFLSLSHSHFSLPFGTAEKHNSLLRLFPLSAGLLDLPLPWLPKSLPTLPYLSSGLLLLLLLPLTSRKCWQRALLANRGSSAKRRQEYRHLKVWPLSGDSTRTENIFFGQTKTDFLWPVKYLAFL